MDKVKIEDIQYVGLLRTGVLTYRGRKYSVRELTAPEMIEVQELGNGNRGAIEYTLSRCVTNEDGSPFMQKGTAVSSLDDVPGNLGLVLVNAIKRLGLADDEEYEEVKKD